MTSLILQAIFIMLSRFSCTLIEPWLMWYLSFSCVGEELWEALTPNVDKRGPDIGFS